MSFRRNGEAGMHILNGRRRRKVRKVVAGVMVMAFLVTVPASDGALSLYMDNTYDVYAKTAKEKKKEAEEKLNNVQDEIEGIKDKKSEVSKDIDATSQKLDALLESQKKLDKKITNKQTEIDECREDLKAAEKKQEEEYDLMKKRIRFMYANSTSDSIWMAILDSTGISELLNRIEYISDVYQSDRELMNSYKKAVSDVKKLSKELEGEMEDLLEMQDEYSAKQDELEQLIASLENKKDKYADQLAEAKRQAVSYKKTIKKQAAIIQRQEAEAARIAAEQAASYQGGGTGNGGVSKDEKYLNDSSYNPSPTTSVTGQQIVQYALQFRGNPYVWGGNSLTHGCDCSGFVHLVYAHFGISTPRQSQAFKTQGKPVSFSNIQAGDVVVYPGHVAIYIGNGCIVEAQSSKAGITSYRSVQCHTITAIRRYV